MPMIETGFVKYWRALNTLLQHHGLIGANVVEAYFACRKGWTPDEAATAMACGNGPRREAQ